MNIGTFFSYFINPSKIDDLIKINKNLRTANEKKDEILSSISHEIRNPIGIIIGASYLLKDSSKDLLNKACQGYIDEIEESSKEILELLEDLLDMSQLNSDEFTADLSKRIDLSQIIKRAVKTSSHAYIGKRVTIRSDIGNLPEINLDGRRIKQILINLISNAIKYSDQNKEINVSANVVNGKIEIIVTDQGFGMSEEDIEIALQKYQTINNKNTGRVDSFGLGLPLIKHLVEIQNGTLDIKSKYDQGTKVAMQFSI